MTDPSNEPTADLSVPAEAPWQEESRPLVERLAIVVPLTWETAVWLALTVAAFVSRFWALGARAMSHDESLHVYYSWQLAIGNGYAHNPMMHGPFLYEATAIFDRLFGASDFGSRLVPALLGIGVVIAAPLLLRAWLGRWGSLAASAFLLISPYVLYYSRYNRHDLQVVAWVLLAVFALFSYLRSREEKHLLLLAGALALMFATMETTFFYLVIFAGFLALRLVFGRLLSGQAVRGSAEFDLLVVVSTLGAFFSSPIALLALNPIWKKLTGAPFVDLTVLSSFGIEWASTPAGPRLWGLLAVFAAAAAIIGVWWGGQRWLKLAGLFLGITVTLFTTFFTNLLPGLGTGFIGSLGYWLSQQGVARGGQPDYYYFIVFPLYEYLPIVLGLAAAAACALKWRRLSAAARTFVPFAMWWGLVIFTGLSLAGEKMPWLSTHITVPFILLAGWWVGTLLERPAPQPDEEPFQPARGGGLRWVGLAVAAGLALVTARTSYYVNYVNYDYTTEFVGYAHGAPGIKWVAEDIDQLAQLTGAGKNLVVGSDSQVAWPMSWYLRDYGGFFGDKISRSAVANAQVVVVGPDNWKKADLYLGQDYHRYEVIRMWWPMEDYKNLTWQRVRYAFTDPDMRRALWDIFWRKDYTLYAGLTQQEMDPPRQWPLSESMRVYIRKDVAQLAPTLKLDAYKLPDVDAVVDAYTPLRIQPQPRRALQPGDLNAPRNVAAAPDGSVYVADTGNSQIVHLSPDGTVDQAWGSRTPDGQAPPQPGTFNEPWGIAVDSSGNVYVADTWNHRIQKFDAQGSFLLQWGVGGVSADGGDRFWGPRAVAVAPDGRVYVTDTGNKRVAVFDANGAFQFEFSTVGEAALDEPVGLAVGANGIVYVADTWNMRIAEFSLEGQFLGGWQVQAWNSDSLDNKPYIAIDAKGQIYVTDPEGYRVIVFSPAGEPVATFGQVGEDENAFGLPTGISAGPDGSIWIADAGNNRVVQYAGVGK